MAGVKEKKGGFSILGFFLIIALAVVVYMYLNPDKAAAWKKKLFPKKATTGQGEDVLAGFPDPITL